MARPSAATQRSAVVSVCPVFGEAQNQKKKRRDENIVGEQIIYTRWFMRPSPCLTSSLPNSKGHDESYASGESTVIAGRPTMDRPIHQG